MTKEGLCSVDRLTVYIQAQTPEECKHTHSQCPVKPAIDKRFSAEVSLESENGRTCASVCVCAGNDGCVRL